MASLGEDIRTFILASTGIAGASTALTLARANAVTQNSYPVKPPDPRIWYRRAGSETVRCLGGEAGPKNEEWDLEVIGGDIDEVLAIVPAVKTRFDGYQGAMGSSSRTVQAIFVDDHDDDYEPRGVASEEAVNVSALRLTIFTS